MIDLLLSFPSQEVAAQVGAALGYTTPDGQGGWNTTQATLSLGICVIGEHFIPQPDDGQGDPVPPVGDGKWWVMVRSLEDIAIPAQIQQFIVAPDPNNPAIPNRSWA